MKKTIAIASSKTIYIVCLKRLKLIKNIKFTGGTPWSISHTKNLLLLTDNQGYIRILNFHTLEEQFSLKAFMFGIDFIYKL